MLYHFQCSVLSLILLPLLQKVVNLSSSFKCEHADFESALWINPGYAEWSLYIGSSVRLKCNYTLMQYIYIY